MMNKQPLEYRAYAGVGMTEYAVLLGLLAVVAIAGVNMLGGSVRDLFKQANTTLGAKNSLSMVAAPQNPLSAAALPSAKSTAGNAQGGWMGSGYYALMTDPVTGQPSLKLVDGSSAEMTNLTSVDGNAVNALGSVRLAKALDILAQQQSDPSLAQYYATMAKSAYYLGGSEGELDHMLTLLQGWDDPSTNTGYTAHSGLSDIAYYQSQLQQQLQNPPAGLNMQEFKQVMPLAAEVFNIAQNYGNHFSAVKDAPVIGNPANCKKGIDCALGNGRPGSAMTGYAQATTDPTYADGKWDTASTLPAVNPTSLHYDQITNYANMKKKAAQAMAAYPLDTGPVITTFKDAKSIDTHGVPTVTPVTSVNGG
jgi:Flp pilus assembly pilin Flp